MDHESLLRLFHEGDIDAANELLRVALRSNDDALYRQVIEKLEGTRWPGFLPRGKNEGGFEQWLHAKTGMLFVELPAYDYLTHEDSSDWPYDRIVREAPRVRRCGSHFLMATTLLSPFVLTLMGKDLGVCGPVFRDTWRWFELQLHYPVALDPLPDHAPPVPVETAMPLEMQMAGIRPQRWSLLSWEQTNLFCVWADLFVPTISEWEQAAHGPVEYGGGRGRWAQVTAFGATIPAGIHGMGRDWERCAEVLNTGHPHYHSMHSRRRAAGERDRCSGSADLALRPCFRQTSDTRQSIYASDYGDMEVLKMHYLILRNQEEQLSTLALHQRRLSAERELDESARRAGLGSSAR